MSRSKTVYAEASVDVDLDEWSDEELFDELKERNASTPYITTIELDDIYKQFAFGNEAEGIRLMKRYLEDATGKVLP